MFDSGVGGLCVLNHCAALLPHEKFVYLADRANMPYGVHAPEDIRRFALCCADTLVKMNCKAVVVACNTATEHAIDELRRIYPTVAFVGLEPAVKPCLREMSNDGYAVALVTEATARSERFRRLTDGESRVRVLPQPRLAALIEKADDIGRIKSDVFCMLDGYRDAEAVVLGCSHYTLVTGLIREFYGGRIKIYDGACGAAARLKQVLKAAGELAPDSEKSSLRFYSTQKAPR